MGDIKKDCVYLGFLLIALVSIILIGIGGTNITTLGPEHKWYTQYSTKRLCIAHNMTVFQDMCCQHQNVPADCTDNPRDQCGYNTRVTGRSSATCDAVGVKPYDCSVCEAPIISLPTGDTIANYNAGASDVITGVMRYPYRGFSTSDSSGVVTAGDSADAANSFCNDLASDDNRIGFDCYYDPTDTSAVKTFVPSLEPGYGGSIAMLVIGSAGLLCCIVTSLTLMCSLCKTSPKDQDPSEPPPVTANGEEEEEGVVQRPLTEAERQRRAAVMARLREIEREHDAKKPPAAVRQNRDHSDDSAESAHSIQDVPISRRRDTTDDITKRDPPRPPRAEPVDRRTRARQRSTSADSAFTDDSAPHSQHSIRSSEEDARRKRARDQRRDRGVAPERGRRASLDSHDSEEDDWEQDRARVTASQPKRGSERHDSFDDDDDLDGRDARPTTPPPSRVTARAAVVTPRSRDMDAPPAYEAATTDVRPTVGTAKRPATSAAGTRDASATRRVSATNTRSMESEEEAPRLVGRPAVVAAAPPSRTAAVRTTSTAAAVATADVRVDLDDENPPPYEASVVPPSSAQGRESRNESNEDSLL